jgi:hypothetical protein
MKIQVFWGVTGQWLPTLQRVIVPPSSWPTLELVGPEAEEISFEMLGITRPRAQCNIAQDFNFQKKRYFCV